jgi:hypothetical protein
LALVGYPTFLSANKAVKPTMSRLINNQIWNARSFSNLSVEDKLLFLYLETSPETNYYGVFILPPDSVISARTGLTLQKVKNSLDELQRQGKICLVDDYLIIFDYFDRQKNNESEKTKKGLENFEKSLPNQVLETWLKGKSYPLHTPLIPPSNPLEEKKVKESKVNIKENESEVKEILNFYNETFSKNFKTAVGWKKNFEFWLTHYTLDEIKTAIRNLNHPNWWANKPKNGEPAELAKLDFLFRRSNSKGDCDYIGELLNLVEIQKEEFIEINLQPQY